ncbi:MAG: type II toxin-antitoxin system HicA family toxin [Nitrospirota bacterium]
MRKLPALTGKKIISLLKKAGFAEERQKGSHIFLKHSDGRATVVPVHSGETIGPGLLSKILRDVEMTKDDFLKILEVQAKSKKLFTRRPYLVAKKTKSSMIASLSLHDAFIV